MRVAIDKAGRDEAALAVHHVRAIQAGGQIRFGTGKDDAPALGDDGALLDQPESWQGLVQRRQPRISPDFFR